MLNAKRLTSSRSTNTRRCKAYGLRCGCGSLAAIARMPSRKAITCIALAIRYNTTVEVLKRHNNLSSNHLTIGQRLLLPACPPEAVSFAPGAEVCFEAPGRIALIDTATPERTIHALQSYESAGMTCGKISQPGVVVLVASGSS